MPTNDEEDVERTANSQSLELDEGSVLTVLGLAVLSSGGLCLGH